MKLSDLDACFLANYNAETDSFCEQKEIQGAQGVMFDCPLCKSHAVICWFKNPINAACVPDSAFPRPGRWTVTGTSIENLTLQPSVNLDTPEAQQSEARGFHPCKWHGFVQNGDAT